MARVFHAMRSCLFFTVFSAVAVCFSAPSQVWAGPSNPSPPEQAVEAARVVATGTLSAHAVLRREQVRMWLTITNTTPHCIRDVWMMLPFDAPDYEIEKIYKWSASPGPAGNPSSQPLGTTSTQLIAKELGAGDSITVWADFQPRQTHESRTLNALVSWKSSHGSPSQISAPLGDLQVQGWWDEWRESFVYQVVKDFALPLVVLLLPFLIQRMARKRAHLAETWNLMLPDSHHTTMTYYMPMQASLRHALDELDAYSKETDAAGKTTHARALFFHFLVFQRRLRFALSKLGGFYFKDRTGERLAVYCLIEVDKLYPGKDESDKIAAARILKHLGINETLDSFLEKLDGTSTKPKIQNLSPLFQKCWLHFYGAAGPPQISASPSAPAGAPSPVPPPPAPTGTGSAPAPAATVTPWLGSQDFKDAIVCLKAFGAIIEFEMNRPYEHWYGEREIIHIDDPSERKLKKLAKEAAVRENIPNFPQEVRRYLSKGKNTSWVGRLVGKLRTTA